MIQKSKQKNTIDKLITLNNIDKKYNLDELTKKIFPQTKEGKSFKDGELKNEINNKKMLLDKEYDKAILNRKNNPYKCIIKKFDYSKKITDEKELIVFRPKDEDKINFINDYNKQKDIKKQQDIEIKNIYTDDKKDDYVKQFEYKHKYKYNISVENTDSDLRVDRIIFYKKEQEKNNNNNINDIFDDLIKKGALSENLDNIDYDKINADELEQQLIKEFGKEKYEELMKSL